MPNSNVFSVKPHCGGSRIVGAINCFDKMSVLAIGLLFKCNSAWIKTWLQKIWYSILSGALMARAPTKEGLSHPGIRKERSLCLGWGVPSVGWSSKAWRTWRVTSRPITPKSALKRVQRGRGRRLHPPLRWDVNSWMPGILCWRVTITRPNKTKQKRTRYNLYENIAYLYKKENFGGDVMGTWKPKCCCCAVFCSLLAWVGWGGGGLPTGSWRLVCAVAWWELCALLDIDSQAPWDLLHVCVSVCGFFFSLPVCAWEAVFRDPQAFFHLCLSIAWQHREDQMGGGVCGCVRACVRVYVHMHVYQGANGKDRVVVGPLCILVHEWSLCAMNV